MKKRDVTFNVWVIDASLSGIGACSSRVDNWDEERTASGSSPSYTNWANDWNSELSRAAYCKF